MKTPVIVCVDDEKIVLDSLKMELCSVFHDMLRLEIAESADEALEIIEEFKKDGHEIPLIISDWLMPGMKGDEFLIQVHKQLPETKKILLTGQATTEGVTNVVNNAKLYRYIAKPWESKDLELTITEAFKSYFKEKQVAASQKALAKANNELEETVRQRTLELENSQSEIRDVLDKTLKGSVNAIFNIISKSNPVIFDKSIRVRDITKRIVYNLGIQSIWEFEIAALLSQLGCFYISQDIIEKYFSGKVISQTEFNVFKLHPEKAYDILNRIPHLENVSEGILNMFSEDISISKNFNNASAPSQISMILRVAHDYDQNILNKIPEDEIESLFKKQKKYNSEVVNALFTTTKQRGSGSSNSKVKSIAVSDLKVGMILAENIKSQDGKVILHANEEITQLLLMVLVQERKKAGIIEPIFIYNF